MKVKVVLFVILSILCFSSTGFARMDVPDPDAYCRSHPHECSPNNDILDREDKSDSGANSSAHAP